MYRIAEWATQGKYRKKERKKNEHVEGKVQVTSDTFWRS
jgi:hypothetical protein